MPRIADDFLDCAIFLYPGPAEARSGSDAGGSGFLVAVPVPDIPGVSFTVAVTNRHVIETGNPVVRLNNKGGDTTVYDIPETSWIFHPDDQDLAAVAIPVAEDTQQFRRMAYSGLMTKEKAVEWDIGPGTDTFMVGRFITRDGVQTNVPTVRFGNVAQMPSIQEDDYGRKVESFLIETRSISGFSGSPIFAHIPPFAWRPKTKTIDDAYWGPALLAVDWANISTKEPVIDGSGRETLMHVFDNTGVALAVPAWRLIELLNCDPMKAALAHLRASYP